MPSPAFDTHAEIRKLQEAGCPEEQAEAMVDLVSRTPTDSRVLTRLDGVDSRLDGIDTRLDGIETRLNGIDRRLDGIDTRLDRFDVRFDRLEGRFDRLEYRVEGMVTKAEFAEEFAKLYKHILIGGVGLTSLIIACNALF